MAYQRFHVYINGGKWGDHRTYREAQAHAMREIRRRAKWNPNVADIVANVDIREVWINEVVGHKHTFTFNTLPTQTKKMILKNFDARDIAKLKLEGKL